MRTFEKPPLRERAPDNTKETFKKGQPKFEPLQVRFKAIDTAGMTVDQQVDRYILRTEMNGYRRSATAMFVL